MWVRLVKCFHERMNSYGAEIPHDRVDKKPCKDISTQRDDLTRNAEQQDRLRL